MFWQISTDSSRIYRDFSRLGGFSASAADENQQAGADSRLLPVRSLRSFQSFFRKNFFLSSPSPSLSSLFHLLPPFILQSVAVIGRRLLGPALGLLLSELPGSTHTHITHALTGGIRSHTHTHTSSLCPIFVRTFIGIKRSPAPYLNFSN